MERRRDIPGFEGDYAITDAGRVISLHKEAIGLSGAMAVVIDKNGYVLVKLRIGGKQRLRRVSRLVLLAFCGPAPTAAHEANHLDGNKKNNSIKNLAWVTPIENTHHAIMTGLVKGRSPCVVDFEGASRPLIELCRERNVNYQAAYHRTRLGWTVAMALEKPTIGFRNRYGVPQNVASE